LPNPVHLVTIYLRRVLVYVYVCFDLIFVLEQLCSANVRVSSVFVTLLLAVKIKSFLPYSLLGQIRFSSVL